MLAEELRGIAHALREEVRRAARFDPSDPVDPAVLGRCAMLCDAVAEDLAHFEDTVEVVRARSDYPGQLHLALSPGGPPGAEPATRALPDNVIPFKRD